MGNVCGIDIFQRLSTQFLEDFTKIIILQSSQQLLVTSIPDIKTKLNQFYDTFQKSAHFQIEQKTQIAYSYLDDIVNQVQKQYQTTLSTIQANGHTIQQMLHIQELKKPIQEHKNKAKTQLSNQRAKIFDQIDQIHQKLFNQFQIQKPYLRLYNQLPPDVQQEINMKAKQRFKSKIAQQNQVVLKLINEKIGDQKFIQDLKIFDPTAQLMESIQLSKRMVQNYKVTTIQFINSMLQQNQKNQKITPKNDQSSI